MAQRKKLTPAEQAYNKELRRINRFIKAAEQRGFLFNLKIIPPRPKKITKANVKKLASITPATLYAKASYQTEDNRILTGEEGRALERSRASKKAAETVRARKKAALPTLPKPTPPKGPPSIVDSVLASIEDLIARFPDGNVWAEWQEKIHTRHKNMLEGMLNTQIMLYGRTRVAMRLEKVSGEIAQLAERIIYGDSDDQSFQLDIQWFARIIKGENLTADEALDLEDLMEQYEG